MVLIEAIVKSFKLDDVKEALEELGVGGLTVTEVMQSAPPRQGGHSVRAGRPTPDLVPKLKIQVVARKELAERIVEALCLHGSSGKTEDGRIIVKKVQTAVRIRTGELDELALTS